MAELLDNLDKTSGPGWPRRRCQVVDDTAAARACEEEEDGAVEGLGSRSVYRGPELSHLTITFLVVRSFTDKPKGSNSIEQ